jgi:hypothetical protein
MDSLAVASAVFGFTAIIPVVSQVAGLALGISSLVRIRRARRAGRHLRGGGWAVAGIVSSSLMLIGWLVALGALIAVSAYFVQAADALPALDAAMQ